MNRNIRKADHPFSGLSIDFTVYSIQYNNRWTRNLDSVINPSGNNVKTIQKDRKDILIYNRHLFIMRFVYLKNKSNFVDEFVGFVYGTRKR